jgi:hypothetical protein
MFPPAWALGEVLTTPLRKKRMLIITHVEMLSLETNQSGGKLFHLSDLRRGVFLEEVLRSGKKNRHILLGTWNVRSLNRAGSLMAAARKLARYKLDLLGVQEVRWDK